MGLHPIQSCRRFLQRTIAIPIVMCLGASPVFANLMEVRAQESTDTLSLTSVSLATTQFASGALNLDPWTMSAAEALTVPVPVVTPSGQDHSRALSLAAAIGIACLAGVIVRVYGAYGAGVRGTGLGWEAAGGCIGGVALVLAVYIAAWIPMVGLPKVASFLIATSVTHPTFTFLGTVGTGLLNSLSPVTVEVAQALLEQASTQALEHFFCPVTNLVNLSGSMRDCFEPLIDAAMTFLDREFVDEAIAQGQPEVALYESDELLLDYTSGQVVGVGVNEVNPFGLAFGAGDFGTRSFVTPGGSTLNAVFNLTGTPSHARLNLAHLSSGTGDARIRVRVNGSTIASGYVVSSPQSAEFDVSGLLVNGSNAIEIFLEAGSPGSYELGALTVLATGASATPVSQPAPQLSASKTVVGGGESFQLSWSQVSGASSYILESSASAGFVNPSSEQVFSTSATRSIETSGSPVTRYYRVKAPSTPFSNSVSVTALPQISPGAMTAEPNAVNESSFLGGESRTVDVALSISGQSSFTWSALPIPANGPSNWLKVVASTGGSQNPVRIKVDPQNITTAGMYTGKVEVRSTQAASNPLIIPVSFNVTDPGQSGVDIAVTRLAWAPNRHPCSGNSLRLAVEVKNVGSTGATSTGNAWTDVFWSTNPDLTIAELRELQPLDELRWGARYPTGITSLNAGASFVDTAYFQYNLPQNNCPQGQSYIYAVADMIRGVLSADNIRGVIPESNDTDQARPNNIFILPLFNPRPAKLTIAPEAGTLSMTTSGQGTLPLVVSNGGDVALTWSAGTLPSGIALSPASGTVQPLGSQTVTVVGTGNLLPVGSSSFSLPISSNGGNASFDLTTSVLLTAVLEATPTLIRVVVPFGASGVVTRSIQLSNSGEVGSVVGAVTVTKSPAGPGVWLGTPGPSINGVPATQTIELNPSGLGTGTHAGTVTFTPASVNAAPASIEVELVVEPVPVIGASSVVFQVPAGGAQTSNGSSQILNVGAAGTSLSGLYLGPTTYQAGASGWITGVSLSGASAPATLTVGVDAAGVVNGSYDATIELRSTMPGVQSVIVPVSLTKAGTAPPLNATQLTVVTQPGGSVSGVALATPPVVELRSSDGQPVLQSGVTVSVTVASGGGTLSGPLTTVTNTEGRATFTGLIVTGSGAHTLQFASSGLASATSASFTTDPGQCTLTLTAEPTSGGSTTGSGTGPCGRSQAITATASSGYAFTGWSDGNTNASRTVAVSSTNQTLTANFSQNECTLTLTVNPTAGGTTTGSGTGACGRSQAITATANSGYSFTGWSDGDTNASRTVTVSTTNQSLTADFTQNQCTLTLTVNPTSGGTTSGSGAGPCGRSQAITATANSDYTFTGWSDGNTEVSRTVTVSSTNQTLTANFSQNQCTLTLTANPTAGGTTTGSGTGACGRSQEISATANSDYAFTGWSDGNTNASRTVTVSSANQSLTANFTQNQCTLTLTVNPTSGGTTSGSGTGPCGRSQAITATANSSFTFTVWSDGNTNASRTVTVSSTNQSLTANFTADPGQCTLALTANPTAGGTTTGSGTGVCGRSQAITATASSDYTFTDWSDGNTNASRTVTVSSTNQSLTANFTQNQCTLTLTASPADGGTTTGSGAGACGRSQAIAATANSGYTFTVWSDGNTNPSRMVTVSNTNQSLTANFSLNPCTLTLTANPVAGGTTTGSGTGACGRTQAITATANSGYTFTGWSDGNTNASRSVTVSTNQSLTANFSQNQCTLTLTANPAAGGTTTGSGTGACERSQAITATAASGYTFLGWSDGNAAANRTVAVSSTNQSLTANFSQNQCTLTLTANPTAGGTTTGSGTGACGRSQAITATATSGYTFTGWSDGNTNATRIVTVNSASQILAAHFVGNSTLVPMVANALLGVSQLDAAVAARIDAEGNANGTLDIGDLAALIFRSPGLVLTPTVLKALTNGGKDDDQ